MRILTRLGVAALMVCLAATAAVGGERQEAQSHIAVKKGPEFIGEIQVIASDKKTHPIAITAVIEVRVSPSHDFFSLEDVEVFFYFQDVRTPEQHYRVEMNADGVARIEIPDARGEILTFRGEAMRLPASEKFPVLKGSVSFEIDGVESAINCRVF